MSNKEVGELTAAGPLTGTELVHVVQSGNSRKTSATTLAAFVGGMIPYGGARIRSASLQNYTLTGAFTAMRFDTADRDTHGFWSSSQPNRFTVPAGVTKIRLSASVKVDSADTIENNQFTFGKNGVTQVTSGLGNMGIANVGYSNPGGTLVSDVLDVVAGDYFELFYFSSGTWSANADRGLTWFAIELVEATSTNARLDSLIDVDTSTDAPAVGESLIWDGAKWVPGVPVVAVNVAEGVNKPFRGALAKFNTDRNVASWPIFPLTWEGVDYDTDSLWSAGNPSRFTIPTGVTKIRLSATIDMTNTGTEVPLAVHFGKNGSTDFRGSAMNITDSDLANPVVSTTSPVISVVAGDYFEVRVNSTSTGTRTLNASRCFFAIEIVEATVTA